MTDDKAEAMLAKLSRHYGERVAPVGRYCDALETWAGVMRTYNAEVYAAAQTVRFALGKSNLAARLVYGGEALRTVPCPVHKGHWSGCVWPDDSRDACPCMSGCNVTGWLPNEKPKP